MKHKLSMTKQILLISISFLSVGCTTNTYLDESLLSPIPIDYTEPVFLANPKIDIAYEVIETANLYKWVLHNAATYRLKEVRLDRDYVCGNPIIGSAIFLGFLPVSLPYTHRISYYIESHGVDNYYEHVIPLYTRTSMWEWLAKPFVSSEKQLLVKGLRLTRRMLKKSYKLIK